MDSAFHIGFGDVDEVVYAPLLFTASTHPAYSGALKSLAWHVPPANGADCSALEVTGLASAPRKL